MGWQIAQRIKALVSPYDPHSRRKWIFVRYFHNTHASKKCSAFYIGILLDWKIMLICQCLCSCPINCQAINGRDEATAQTRQKNYGQ